MEKFLSISEMASIHNVSRQTLIYYDKIDLFKPIYTDENGYRYYSPHQIPILREIYFLKSLGVKLNDIKDHIDNRDLTSAMSLLQYQNERITSKITSLLKIKESIQQRLQKYSEAENYKSELYRPIIEEYPEREMVFVPYENKFEKEEMHLTLMKAWNILMKYGILPSEGFGTIIMKDAIRSENLYEGAGIFVTLPVPNVEIENKITVPAGRFVCMYKYGMPYDDRYLKKLVKWIDHNNYKIIGDIVDACLLDTTFHKDDNKVDFCQLQIPIDRI